MNNNLQKRCSVIIPVYQAEKHISFTLDSCLSQAEYIKEIILIDDFSIDNSWDILLQYQNNYPDLIKAFKNVEKGGNNARNYGFSLSTGDYIQWLDADDAIIQGKLKAQITFLEANIDVDIAYSGWQMVESIDNNILIYSQLNPTMQYSDYLFELLRGYWPPPHAYLLKRNTASKLARIKAWNPITRISQDWEYFTKAAILGSRFDYVAGIHSIYYRRLNETSASRSISNEDKAKESIRLLSSLYEEIRNQSWIHEKNKIRYNKLLLAQILRNSLWYNLPFDVKNEFISNVDWNSIKGIKAKFEKLESLKDIL